MGVAYTQEIGLSKKIGGFLNWCFDAGIISDAQVAAQATLTLLLAAIDAAVVKTEQRPLVTQLGKCFDAAVTLGVIPETHGVTTVADMVALTDAGTDFKSGFFH